MNAEIKRRWIDALRSGDFSQTQGFLADDRGFCCLGVLCEIAVEDGIVTKSLAGGGDTTGIVKYDSPGSVLGSMSLLDNVLVDWAGTEDSNPRIPMAAELMEKIPDGSRHMFQYEFATLSGLNDCGFTFDQIADLIEEYL